MKKTCGVFFSINMANFEAFCPNKSWPQTFFFWRVETVGKGPPAVSRLRTCGLKNVSLTLKVLTAPTYHPLPTKYLNQQQFGSCFVVNDQGTLYSHGSTAWLSLWWVSNPFFQIPTGVASKLKLSFCVCSGWWLLLCWSLLNLDSLFEKKSCKRIEKPLLW